MGVSWLLQSNNFEATPEIVNGSGVTDKDGASPTTPGGMIVRGDTLERNPGFMNPQEMTERQEVTAKTEEEPDPSAAVASTTTPMTHVKMEGVNRQQMIFNEETHTVTVIQSEDLGQWQTLSTEEVIAVASGANSSPTGANPADKAWPGGHGFKMNFMKLSQNAKNKSWDVSLPIFSWPRVGLICNDAFFQYSADLNKLFIDMGKYVQITFHAGQNPPEGYFIRALPIYASPSHLSDVVKRCPNHASLSDASNNGFNPVKMSLTCI